MLDWRGRVIEIWTDRFHCSANSHHHAVQTVRSLQGSSNGPQNLPVQRRPPFPNYPARSLRRSTEFVTQSSLEIVTDASRVDASVVHALLADSYWGEARTLSQTERAISHSTPFAVYDGSLLIGFARVISDRLTLAYLADMYVIPQRRGAGIGTLLLRTILDHMYFVDVSRWMLRTVDAQSLYSRFGFELVAADDTLMVLDRNRNFSTG